jgi:hypothetical protein
VRPFFFLKDDLQPEHPMTSRLPSLAFLLSSLPAAAADLEEATAGAPPATVDLLYVVLFIVVFLGGIVAVLMYFLWEDDGGNPKGRD